MLHCPLDTGLNVAIKQVADRIFPTGFDVASEAPETFEALVQHVETTGRMLVWSGGSDETIYACPETNYAFRAWHDWCHLTGNHAFTPEGERAACAMQQAHLLALYGDNPTTRRWCAILDAEINGQVAFNQATGGEFPVDQYSFVQDCLATCVTAAVLKHAPRRAAA